MKEISKVNKVLVQCHNDEELINLQKHFISKGYKRWVSHSFHDETFAFSNFYPKSLEYFKKEKYFRISAFRDIEPFTYKQFFNDIKMTKRLNKLSKII